MGRMGGSNMENFTSRLYTEDVVTKEATAGERFDFFQDTVFIRQASFYQGVILEAP